MGTQSGIYVIDELKNTVKHVHEDLMGSSSLSSNTVEKIYKDKEDGIWIGTNFGGVSYLPNRGSKFE